MMILYGCAEFRKWVIAQLIDPRYQYGDPHSFLGRFFLFYSHVKKDNSCVASQLFFSFLCKNSFSSLTTIILLSTIITVSYVVNLTTTFCCDLISLFLLQRHRCGKSYQIECYDIVRIMRVLKDGIIISIPLIIFIMVTKQVRTATQNMTTSILKSIKKMAHM